MSVFRTKSVERSIRETDEPGNSLRRELSALDLTVFGVGVIVGTGIFVLTGEVAKKSSGPAVALSFVAAGIACALAALCYAEFASTVPVAGSAYTFSYATIGELPAWIIGWDLMLELALGAATVAVGWSGYAKILLDDMGIHLPTSVVGEDATFNIPAMLIVLAVTALLVTGVKISSRVNAVIVTIKIAVVLFVIVAGLFFIKGGNYHPFVPKAESSPDLHGGKAPLIQVLFGYTPSTYGWAGIIAGAAIVFFAFIGFDVVATAAEETKKPKRDLPIGIIASLVICTLLYVAVSLVVTGMQNYRHLSVDAPLAEAFKSVGHPGFATIISVGALAGLTTVVLILMLGQSRVFFAMSRDGLLPSWLAEVHPRFGTPYRVTIIIGVVVALIAGLVPLSALAELVNIGTLFAFIVVSIGVVVLRRTHPDLPRSFRVPASPVVPILAVLACGYLMLNLPVETWLRFVIWMIIGFVVYFLYGRGHSRVGKGRAESS
ncbi:amino acid permease [Actinoallomurus bryophytorum]|uniref:Amino acid/polyamine/organocation transporter (APC superfamily) n=1 Tax=Actinoallomurus bryophytorum TaxID=1490222 RepID=A0A543CS11_9ACTN|nr:amino acid permease [Actinoallomurus bryophytorum]TQL99895.1 amino acid/polyamine/organocation transporter (APC superfamily) [Actinoallomurus bryophytorum]